MVTICTTIQQFYALPTQCIYVFCMDLDVRCIGRADSDTNQYLVIAKVRGGLSKSQQEAQWFD